MRRLLILATVSAIVWSGCGDSESAPTQAEGEDAVRSAIDRFTEDQGDPALCTEAVTARLLAELRAVPEDEAITQCEEEAADALPSLERIEPGEVVVEGESATASVAAGEQQLSLEFVLDDDAWKLDGVEIVDFDLDGYLADLRRDLSAKDGPVSAEVARCVVREVGKLDAQTVADSLLSSEPWLQAFIDGCDA